ncbi:pyridoxal phosphate-dependent aminotransferase [Rhodococcus sp. BP-316]|uniref:pyridoxal phosphate-dependent aminotransferase n=1 Tax=Rhodococcus sp. BP-316 TaxID=2739445 RepID=UPI001C9B31D9|nr:pyridoxal phosphate-dependent aminotransferase [Rhodococcus sp. BP-316]MBY6683315.1 pyridoxal phosphate-dependent aminotransferase [Rhodococcus sp. BP-316]
MAVTSNDRASSPAGLRPSDSDPAGLRPSSRESNPAGLRPSRTVARLRPFASTIFAEMTALAATHDAVNLGQGFPDTDGPARMLEVAREAIASGLNQYPPGPGMAVLRDAVARDRVGRYGTEYDPDSEILVTVGATEAISAAMLGLVESGDEVLLVEPYYDSYAAAVALAGAQRRTVPLVVDGDRFALDVDALRSAVGPRTRMIVVNSPHNPTGTVFTASELAAIAEVACEHDLLVLTDEVYERLVFDDAVHTPIATLPGMAERTITVSSAAKTFNATGWKTGWACGPADLIAAVKAAKQFMTFVGGAPFQPAVAHALDHESAWVDALRTGLQAKRDTLSAALSHAGLDVKRSEGTYFVCADIAPLGESDADSFCRALPERIGVVGVPVDAFVDHREGWDTLVRFAFCKQDHVLADAASRLARLSATP